MGWTPQGKWPVEQGDETTYALFEDLRKLIWFHRFGHAGRPLAGSDTPDYDPTADYYAAGSAVYCKDEYGYEWLWTCIKPYVKSPDVNMPIPKGSIPGKSYWWRKTARQWKYSDFYPNTGCYMVNWRAQEGRWIEWLACKELPPCLNKFTQAIYRGKPAHLALGHAQERPIEKNLYYNRSEEIVTGQIGSQHQEYHSVEGSTVPSPWFYPYHVMAGTAGDGDPYWDPKLLRGGYQAAVEFVLETGGFCWKTPGDYDNGREDSWVLDNNYSWGNTADFGGHQYICIAAHTATEENAPPNTTYWKLDDPTYLSLADAYWKCNYSAFEAALKLLGHYDWYLDRSYPPDPDQNRRRRFPAMQGCWRRMWKYTFGYPKAAVVVWPSELGDPPFADQDKEWWYSAANVNQAQHDAIRRIAAVRNTTMYEQFRRRHEPWTQWFTLTSGNLNPVAYPNKSNIVNLPDGTRGYDSIYYEIHHQLMNDMYDILNFYAKFIQLEITPEIKFVMRRSTCQNAIDTVSAGDRHYYFNFGSAKNDECDFGASAFEDITDFYNGQVTPAIIGYYVLWPAGSPRPVWHTTGHLWVSGDGSEDDDYLPPLTQPGGMMFFDANGTSDGDRVCKYWFGIRWSGGDDVKKMMIAGGIDKIICDVEIGGALSWESKQEPPEDTTELKYNRHEVKVEDKEIGLDFVGDAFSQREFQTVHFPMTALDEDYILWIRDLNEDKWSEEWVKPLDVTVGVSQSCFFGWLKILFRARPIIISLKALNINLGGNIVE